MTVKVPAIDQLKELAIPTPPISYFPQTWGWWLLLLLVLLLALLWGGRRWWRWRQDRYRREALARLELLHDSLADQASRLMALRALPALLKRVALSMPGSEPAARLSGEAWLAFLARSAPFPLPADFAEDLFTLAYAPAGRVEALSAHRIEELFRLSRRWIGEHHVAI